MASDIRADEWTDRGVVAQLGEHLHGMQGVGGSSPPAPPPTSVKSWWYRDGSPLRPDDGGFVMSGPMDGDGAGTMVTDVEAQARTTGDGRAGRCAPPGRPMPAAWRACSTTCGRSLAGDAAQRGQPAVGGVLHRRDAAHRRRPGAGGRGRWRPDRHGADQHGAQRGEQPRRHAQHRGRRWLAGRRHRLGLVPPPRSGRDQGLLKVALAVFPDNDRAIAVYERAGFVREGCAASSTAPTAACCATSC